MFWISSRFYSISLNFFVVPFNLYSLAKRRKLTQLDENTSDKNSFLSSQAARKAELRSQEDLFNRKRRLDSDAASKALRRSKENRVKRCFRNMKNASCTKISRSIETPDQRTFRHAKNAESTAASRLNETPEQSSLRRATNTQRTAESRLNETPEQSSLRRATNTQRTAESRLNETPEQHALRLTSDAVATALSRAKLRTDFQNSINKFADTICLICNKLCYSKQVQSVRLASLPENILPNELIAQHDVISACHRCVGILRKSRTPTQAYWNNMSLDEIPPEIASLSDVEVRLLSRIIPFVKMVKLGGRFGQHGFHGQAVLFGQDVEEIAEQLPLRISSAGLVIICEQLESVERLRQFSVNIQKLRAALDWLIANNPLYRNVTVNFNNENYDVHEICHVQNDDVTHQEKNTNETTCFQDIGNNRRILRGSFHQSHSKFQNFSRGKQCTSNAAVAITAAKIKETDTWSPNIIDSILISGDRLYSSSIQSRRVPNTAEADVEYLRVHELQVNFEALSHSCLLQIQDETSSICGHLTVSIDGFPNLKNGLIQFFTESDVDGGAIVTCNGVSVAIWKNDNLYYLFDSHSRGPKGRVAQDGTACLMSFTNITQLWSVLKSNLPKSQGNRPDDDQYSITKITPDVHRLHQNETELQNDIYTTANTQQLQSSELTNENIVITSSVLRVVDEPIPELSTVIENNNCDQLPVHQLRRKTDAPLQIAREKRAEELSWFKLFPYGRNGLQENRAHSITPLDYCQARIMGADNRFQRHDYLFYALSVMEFYRAKQNVGVVLRMRQGENRPENLVENIHLNMRNMRGSNAYWQSACSGLIAMVKNIGPPTWFLTLSCNDLNWNDILKAPASDDTVLLGPDETLRNNGRFCILTRKPEEQYVNNYNPQILKLWKGNMDIQPCGNVTAVSYYIAKYTSKHEPQDVGQAVKDAVSKVRSCHGDIGRQLFAVSMAILNHRRVSACECAYRLCHLKLRDSSRKVVFVNTCRPHERYRMLRYDSDDGQTYQNIFDRYIQRPTNLEHLSLAEFAVNYEHTSRFVNDEENGDTEAYEDLEEGTETTRNSIRLLNGSIMKRRRKPAILRTRYYTQTGDREGYFYSYLVAHVPFRNEDDLLADFETCEEAFMEQRNLLRPFHGDSVEQFQFIERELQQVIGQVLALAEPPLLNNFNGQQTENFDVGAIVEGYDPRMADADVDIEGEEVEESSHINITDAEFHHIVRSMNLEQKKIYDEVTKRIRDEVINEANTNVPLKLFVTGGAGSGKSFILKTLVHHIDAVTLPHQFIDILNNLRVGELSMEQYEILLERSRVPLAGDFADGNAVQIFPTIKLVNNYNDKMVELMADSVKIYTVNAHDESKEPATYGQKPNHVSIPQDPNCTGGLLSSIKIAIGARVMLRVNLKVSEGLVNGSMGVIKKIEWHGLRRDQLEEGELPKTIFIKFDDESIGKSSKDENGLIPIQPHSIIFQGGAGSGKSFILKTLVHHIRRCYAPTVDQLLNASFVEVTAPTGVAARLLQTNVRQQNDSQFIDILNNLRVGELSMEQYEILLERSRVPLAGDFADGNAVQIFPTIKLVNNYNDKMVELMADSVKIYTVNAHDESKEPATYGQKPNHVSIPQDPNCTGGLLSSIKIAIGARVMLRVNLKVSEGLVNGSMGVIKKIEWHGLRRDQLEEGELPKTIFIKFDDESIGKSSKDENGLIPIQPHSIIFQ
ncbi:hypothetical protein HW555_009181, partial [Spodoptera exigua]